MYLRYCNFNLNAVQNSLCCLFSSFITFISKKVTGFVDHIFKATFHLLRQVVLWPLMVQTSGVSDMESRY